MSGVKGQINNSRHKRKNQWTAGTAEAIREPEVFAFKIAKDLYPRVKGEIENRGISKQQFCDEMLSRYFEGDPFSEVVREAIATAIQLKEAAISREKKAKRPDEDVIARWQTEIKELEKVL